MRTSVGLAKWFTAKTTLLDKSHYESISAIGDAYVSLSKNM